MPRVEREVTSTDIRRLDRYIGSASLGYYAFLILFLFGGVFVTAAQAQTPSLPKIGAQGASAKKAASPATASNQTIAQTEETKANVAKLLAAPGTGLFSGVVLSPTQQGQWQEMLQDLAPRMEAMATRVRTSEQANHGPADSTTRAAARALFDEQWTSILAILTPDQREQVERNRAALRQQSELMRVQHPKRGRRS